MSKKIKYTAVFVLILGIIGYGFIKVSSELPLFIKERSPLKVSYNKKPFDLRFDIGDYVVYINDKAINNIKDNAIHILKNLSKNNPIKILTNNIVQ